MKMFKKVAIVGIGLMGGSIGLAIRKKRVADIVVGVSRRKSSMNKAIRFKTVHKATLNIKDAVKDADLVIIASPVGKIADLAGKAVKFMKKNAILTDVGSVKEKIVKKAEKIAKGKVRFIGSHPMAGSDKQGSENASENIFDKAALIVTKTKNTDKEALKTLIKFWKKLGCNVFILSPDVHDELISLASYLPHAVSFALAASQKGDSFKLAGGSLRDTTRVALSDPDLWSDIFLSASGPSIRAIRKFSMNLKILEKAIGKKDKNGIKRFLKKSGNLRDLIEK